MMRHFFSLMTPVERRKYPRRTCQLTVEVRFSGQTEPLDGVVADICLGGCYVSTISPPPEGTTVLLTLNGKGKSATISGRTVTCMPGSGMGIEFTGAMDAESSARLQSMIEMLDSAVSLDFPASDLAV